MTTKVLTTLAGCGKISDLMVNVFSEGLSTTFFAKTEDIPSLLKKFEGNSEIADIVVGADSKKDAVKVQLILKNTDNIRIKLSYVMLSKSGELVYRYFCTPCDYIRLEHEKPFNAMEISEIAEIDGNVIRLKENEYYQFGKCGYKYVRVNSKVYVFEGKLYESEILEIMDSLGLMPYIGGRRYYFHNDEKADETFYILCTRHGC